MHEFWTIWKLLGLSIVAAEFVLLLTMFAVPRYAMPILAGMFTLFLLVPVLAAIDIYKLSH